MRAFPTYLLTHWTRDPSTRRKTVIPLVGRRSRADLALVGLRPIWACYLRYKARRHVIDMTRLPACIPPESE